MHLLNQQKNGKSISLRNPHFFFIPIIIALFIGGYYDVLRWMFDRYTSPDSYYSHGVLIPFVTGYFIWLKKNELKNYTPEYSSLGLLVIIFAIFLHILGTLIYIFSISAFSIFFLVLGISLYLFGMQITKLILFPLMFLIFMLPLPLTIIESISFPLKMLVAKVGVWIISILGLPIYREGFNITIPEGHLLVGNPCSGLRSLVSFLALSSVFAYVSTLTNIKKSILFFSAIPIALISNIIRVPLLILISHYWGIDAAAPDTFVHTASGIFVFAIGLILLFSIKHFLEIGYDK